MKYILVLLKLAFKFNSIHTEKILISMHYACINNGYKSSWIELKLRAIVFNKLRAIIN